MCPEPVGECRTHLGARAAALPCPQFERLTNRLSMAGAMQKLKGFLEIDPHLPSDSLPLTNWKHKRGDENSVSPLGCMAWLEARREGRGAASRRRLQSGRPQQAPPIC